MTYRVALHWIIIILIIVVGRIRQRLFSYPVLRHSVYITIVSEISTSSYQYPFSLDFYWLCLCIGDMGCHVVFVPAVTASREPAGELASSKSVLFSADFFLMRRSSIEGSPARFRTCMLVTLSWHLIFRINRRCFIMKACSFFTWLLYTVHVSDPTV